MGGSVTGEKGRESCTGRACLYWDVTTLTGKGVCARLYHFSCLDHLSSKSSDGSIKIYMVGEC